MISFDQVLLLEERVESAVKKIEQLNAENAALRAKVAELSNALNAKSEQFSSFQSDQSKIEEGILKALSRLNAVENVVLQAGGAAQSVSAASRPVVQPQSQPQNAAPKAPVSEPQVAAQPQNSVPAQNAEPSFDSMNVSEPKVSAQNQQVEQPQSEVVAQNQPLPQKIEVPVEPAVQNQPVLEQPSENSSDTQSISSEIGFEFGESDSSSQQPDQVQQGGAAPQESQVDSGAQSQSAQPMFDIF